MDCHLVAE